MTSMGVSVGFHYGRILAPGIGGHHQGPAGTNARHIELRAKELNGHLSPRSPSWVVLHTAKANTSSDRVEILSAQRCPAAATVHRSHGLVDVYPRSVARLTAEDLVLRIAASGPTKKAS